MDGHETGAQLLGLFALGNAIIHFVVSAIIYRNKSVDRNLFYLVTGLVLVFITIAIPVQLDGNWVTLLWAGEAALLFWIGRVKKVPVYEQLSYPLMVLAFGSIIQDWLMNYTAYSPENPASRIVPILNSSFLSSMLFVAAFGFIHVLNRNEKYPSILIVQKGISKMVSLLIPAILLLSLYFAFRLEISTYWNQLYTDSAMTINPENKEYTEYFWNLDFNSFKIIWIINYSLLFVSLLAWVNFMKVRNQSFGLLNLGLIVLALAVFLLQGLYELSELRERYLEQSLSQYYQRGVFNLGIRYISYAFVALALFSFYRSIRQDFMKTNFKVAFRFLLHLSVLWIASSELIHWMNIYHSEQSYKLGLSILWGVYSLFLIVLGIAKKRKTLRVGAIALFAVTLIKLFFYDISHLNTLSKTIVFVSLGVLLLIISFLYNKYKHLITDETEN